MENKLIDIIYEYIKDKNFYNYDNDEELKNLDINCYENLEGEKVIKIQSGKQEYIINCIHTFDGEAR